MSRKQETDIVIVGAGPVGLFAVFACGQLGMRCHVVDALSEIGGQCIALYPEKPIYDIPGFPSVRGRELIARLREQAEPYQARFSLDSLAVGLRRDAQRLFVRTSKDEEILARAVIIAAGPGAFGPNRPPLAGVEALEGTSVHYWVRDPQDLRGKRIVIAGGGDSAVDWAIVLSEIAASVTLVHRRSKFRAPPASINALLQLSRNKKVTLRVPYQVSALEAHERAHPVAVLAHAGAVLGHTSHHLLLTAEALGCVSCAPAPSYASQVLCYAAHAPPDPTPYPVRCPHHLFFRQTI